MMTTHWTVIKSETFIFSLLLVFLTVALPWLVGSSSSAVQNVSGPPKEAAVAPVPYLHQLRRVLPSLYYCSYIVTSLWKVIIVNIVAVVAYGLRFLRFAFAPGFVLAEICFEIFIMRPLAFAQGIMQLLYPIYVFVGIAALVGATLGATGVLGGWLGTYWSQAAIDADPLAEEGVVLSRRTKDKVMGKPLRSVVFAN
ncbi:hypothetical protein FRC02_005232 [Tulasnella sp. 418]|nr:hypothetical protein FRC02_005232 [Tulasnella sp. 418]